jgi:predicted enzyme related to lactoylglutathione lyase
MGSLKENPVHWFEIPVNDIMRAKDFYEFVFECKLDLHEVKMMKMATFPMNNNSIGSGGALVHAKGYQPHHSGTTVYFSVADIDYVLKRVQEKNGKVLIPKTSIGQYGYIAHFEDSEGNQIALHSMSE